MNELTSSEAVLEVTKNHDADVIAIYKRKHKPSELTAEEKKSTVDFEIHKEEIKDYVKELKILKSNLKKIYSLVYRNCTDSVQTMLKADEEYEEKSKDFDHAWLFKKIKIIVSGLDTKVNLRVSLHDTMTNFFLLKQQAHESNDAYLTRFKSMIETLKIAGGNHILVSETLVKKEISNATLTEINVEREKFMAVSFILCSDNFRYKN